MSKDRLLFFIDFSASFTAPTLNRGHLMDNNDPNSYYF